MALSVRSSRSVPKVLNEKAYNFGTHKVPTLRFDGIPDGWQDIGKDIHPQTMEWPFWNVDKSGRVADDPITVVTYQNDPKSQFAEVLCDVYASEMWHIKPFHEYILSNAHEKDKNDMKTLEYIEDLKVETETTLQAQSFVHVENGKQSCYGVLTEFKEIEIDKLHEFEILAINNCVIDPIRTDWDSNDAIYSSVEDACPANMQQFETSQMKVSFVLDCDQNYPFSTNYVNFKLFMERKEKERLKEREQV